MRSVRFACRILLLLAWFVGAAHPTVAQSTADTVDPATVLDRGASELEAVRSSLQSAGPGEDYVALRTRAQVVAVAASASAEALAPRLAAVQATLATIGDPTAGEAPDVRDKRSNLTRERDKLDSDVKRARLLATTARETVEAVNRAVTDLFNRNTLERVASPLTASYWRAVGDNLTPDLARLANFFETAGSRLADAMTSRGVAIIGATSAVALLLVFPLRSRLRRLGETYARDRAPRTRARRSGLAVWFLLVGSLAISLGLALVVQGLEWADALTPSASSLAWSLMLASMFGAVVVSMGEAFLLVDRESWRLLPIGDRAARQFRPFPVVTALVVVVGTGLIELNRIVGATPAANVTANLFVAVLHVALVASVLVAARKLRTGRDREAGEVTARHPLATAAMLLGWVAVVVCILALVRGNVNLALLIGREIIWTVVVVSGAYLLMTAADDLVTTLLSKDSRASRVVSRGFSLRTDTVEQSGLILSVVLRVAIGFVAVAAVLAPLGGGTAPAYTQLSGITSISVGGIVIEPDAVLRALAVILLGLGAVRLVDRWMNGTFLPATNLDTGARNSVSTILRYAGIVIVASWAVSTLGLGLERVALLAGALSVGIGFGLQAITQNFISGLILLAERPVKIGDTIRVGTDEGDVKRINVRSTEIQIGDRSTLIIPNSELITKSVRNMTLANPLGRVQIVFSVPMEEDADEIIAILLDLFADHASVLDDPAPSVMIDSLADGKINFNGIAFVSSPRLGYATRSDLLLRLLRRLKARGVSAEAPPPESGKAVQAEE
jgi:potassium-dependent mechanosensitive channel